jgi:hypothetical protein
MIDLIGSFMIGSMFLLTLFNSLFNIQAYSTNLQSLLILTNLSERAINVLDSHILANVGANPITRANAINTISGTTFTFWGEIDDNNNGIRDDRLITIMDNGNNQLEVRVNGALYAGPYQISPGGLQINYYDANGISTGTNNAVRSVELAITFQTEGIGMDWGSYDQLRYRIRIWKYFKNLVL